MNNYADMKYVLPNFFYVGAGRCGSTWIYYKLCKHEDVFVPPYRSEVHFFDENYNKGLEWYTNKYRQWDGEEAIGDLTPSYIRYPKIARLISSHFPKAKILISLRDPIERAYSHYLHEKRSKWVDMSFEDCFEGRKDIFETSLYYKKVKKYYEEFPEENIKVMIFNDLKKNPKYFINEILDFLQVHQFNDVSTEKENLTVKPKNDTIYRCVKWVVRNLRDINSENIDMLLDTLKRCGLKRVLTEEMEKKPIESGFRSRLIEYYKKDTKNLEKLIGRDLSMWSCT